VIREATFIVRIDDVNYIGNGGFWNLEKLLRRRDLIFIQLMDAGLFSLCANQQSLNSRNRLVDIINRYSTTTYPVKTPNSEGDPCL